MQARQTVGVDIGGTKIAAGIVNDCAEVAGAVTMPTLADATLERSLAQVYAAIEACWRDEIAAIGICAPGPLNPKTGVVLNPPNLPHWRSVPLAQLVSERFRKPCRVENDANAAGLAEFLFGAARGCDCVLYVTVSTGIGTGIILNGRIHHGKNGAAAEGGHVTIDWRGPVCNCGAPGCIEVLASGTAMSARDVLHRPAERIAADALSGDAEALRVLDETAEMLSAWLGSMISALDPDIVVIGGGVSRIGEPLFSRLRERTPRRTINQFASATPIVPAALREHAGVIGAAAVMMA